MNKIIRAVSSTKWLSLEKKLPLYPPFLLMGVKVVCIQRQPIKLRLSLPLGWRSKNSGGSLFGGFQAAIADPVAPMACLMAFPEYHVWTRHLSIDFKLAGNSDLELRFDMSEEQRLLIQAELQAHGRSTPTFEYGLYRSDGQCCSVIHCTVAIRQEGYKPKRANN